MKTRSLIYNARILTQAAGLSVDSLAFNRGGIVAVGNRLEHDSEFRAYEKVDLHGHTVAPGFVDAHTHFYYFALTLGLVSLHGEISIETCLAKIDRFASSRGGDEWVLGQGYAPDLFRRRVDPDRRMLDKVTGRRPAFIFSKDEHTAWVNSRALQMAGIDRHTPQPAGGRIEIGADGEPTGLLREIPAYDPVFQLIPKTTRGQVDRLYGKALDFAYQRGVTGVHSMDGPYGFDYLSGLAQRGKTGLRIEYYAPAAMLPQLHRTRTVYGVGTEYFRLAGVKIFADGSLGSQSAHCFHRYRGSEDNYGIRVTSVDELVRLLRSAARLGLPAAIHAIGDRAVAEVLDAVARAPRPTSGARHRIEHLQLVRRRDIPRLRRLGVVASMQPSHCSADIPMIRKYWGQQGRNAFVFRTLLEAGIDLAFGSDCPIEPLDPIAGIAAAVRRAQPGHRGVFYPEQRITAGEALYAFTVGPAIASGRQNCRGYLLPGYPADFVVLSDDITRVAPTRISQVEVLATVLGGKLMYRNSSLNI